MNEKEKVVEQLKKFIQVVKENEDWHELLEHIFDYHLTVSNSNSVFSEITDHIIKVFRVNPTLLYVYFDYNGEISLDDLNLNQSTYRNIYNTVRSLKMKYGPIVNSLRNANSDPFGLRGTEINIKNNSSTHNLKFTRNDGENLDLDIRPDTLLASLFVQVQGLTHSIQSGIYSFDPHMINNYLAVSEQLNDIFKELIKESE